jgi:hypothetical protein
MIFTLLPKLLEVLQPGINEDRLFDEIVCVQKIMSPLN